jgi:arsenate reductase
MAEGWAKHLKSDSIEPYSAGIEIHGLNPIAVKVMAEVGIDISGHKSKHFSELKGVEFDYVVTVCDDAYEKCPIFPGKTKTVHVGFDDPPRLAKQAGNEQEFQIYRRVRDETRFIKTRRNPEGRRINQRFRYVSPLTQGRVASYSIPFV